MARLQQIVVNSLKPSRLAGFWAAALDGFEVRTYSQAEIDRLAALGLTPETDPAVIVDGPNIEICFQLIARPGDDATRPMHLDIAACDWEDEAERLVSLGATVKETFEDHVWMLDPEGNDFCVVRERREP